MNYGKRIFLWIMLFWIGSAQVFAEPFVQGGPIGSQTSDGYDALGPVVEQPIEFPHNTHAGRM